MRSAALPEAAPMTIVATRPEFAGPSDGETAQALLANAIREALEWSNNIVMVLDHQAGVLWIAAVNEAARVATGYADRQLVGPALHPADRARYRPGGAGRPACRGAAGPCAPHQAALPHLRRPGVLVQTAPDAGAGARRWRPARGTGPRHHREAASDGARPRAAGAADQGISSPSTPWSRSSTCRAVW